MATFSAFNASSHPIVLLTDWNYLLDHGLENPHVYLVRANGSYYEAIDGATGMLTYGGSDNSGATDGTDEDAVQQAAIDATTSGLVWIKGADQGTVTNADGVILVEEYDGILTYNFTNPTSETLCSNPDNAVMFNITATPTNDPTTSAWNGLTVDMYGSTGLTCYLVGGYFGVDSGASDCQLWGLNPLVNITATAGAACNAIGVEIDLNNSKANSLGNGLTVEGTGAFDCSHAIWIKRAGAGEWEYGITFEQVKNLALDFQGSYAVAGMKWTPDDDDDDTFYYMVNAADSTTIHQVKKGGIYIDQLAAFTTNFLEFKHNTTAVVKIDYQGNVIFASDVTLKRYGANILGLDNDIFFSQMSAAGSTFIATNVTGDSNYRFLVQANGQLVLGDGSGAGDTVLYRANANILKTDDAFVADTFQPLTGYKSVDGTSGSTGTVVSADDGTFNFKNGLWVGQT